MEISNFDQKGHINEADNIYTAGLEAKALVESSRYHFMDTNDSDISLHGDNDTLHLTSDIALHLTGGDPENDNDNYNGVGIRASIPSAGSNNTHNSSSLTTAAASF